MIQRLQSRISRLDIHTIEVIRKSSSSTIVKMGGMVIGLAVSIFLGRILGPDGLGIITLGNRIITVLLVVCLIGMRQVVIKEISIARNRNQYEHIGNVMHSAYWLNGGISLIISIIVILCAPWLAEDVFHEPRLQYPLMVFVVALIPQIFSRIFSSALVGYGKIWQSNLVDQTLSIGITGLLLGAAYLLNYNITIFLVAIFYAVGRLGVTFAVWFYWKSIYTFKFQKKMISKRLINTSTPIFYSTVATVFIANADTLFLGSFTSSHEVGLYNVAASIALLTSFFLQVTNSALGPKIASLYESGRLIELEKMIQRITRGLGFIGISQLIIFLIGGRFMLNLWGEDFTSAYLILIVLSMGQLVNISTGAVGLILTMTGNEKVQRNISIYILVFNLGLNFILINLFGAIGAAIVTAISMASSNIASLIYVRKKTGIKMISIK